MQDINKILSDPNNDWEKRNAAVELFKIAPKYVMFQIQLKKLRSLIMGGANEFDDFATELRNLEVPFQLAVKDLRSQVVRESCITIRYR